MGKFYGVENLESKILDGLIQNYLKAMDFYYNDKKEKELETVRRMLSDLISLGKRLEIINLCEINTQNIKQII